MAKNTKKKTEESKDQKTFDSSDVYDAGKVDAEGNDVDYPGFTRAYKQYRKNFNAKFAFTEAEERPTWVIRKYQDRSFVEVLRGDKIALQKQIISLHKSDKAGVYKLEQLKENLQIYESEKTSIETVGFKHGYTKKPRVTDRKTYRAVSKDHVALYNRGHAAGVAARRNLDEMVVEEEKFQTPVRVVRFKSSNPETQKHKKAIERAEASLEGARVSLQPDAKKRVAKWQERVKIAHQELAAHLASLREDVSLEEKDNSDGAYSPTKRTFVVTHTDKNTKKKYRTTFQAYSPRGIVRKFDKEGSMGDHHLHDITCGGKSVISEADGAPCWSGYKQLGTKKKGKRTVPNCVPVNEASSPYKMGQKVSFEHPTYGKVKGEIVHRSISGLKHDIKFKSPTNGKSYVSKAIDYKMLSEDLIEESSKKFAVGDKVSFMHKTIRGTVKNSGRVIHIHPDGRLNIDHNKPFSKTKSYPATVHPDDVEHYKRVG